MAAYDFINLSGVIVADTSATKGEVQQEYRDIFGDDLDLDDETPEGVLINSETLSRNGIANNNANMANQINPNLAGGIFLDAIWALTYALTGGRREATPSTFSQPINLTGVPGTVIPAGSVALSVAGDEFESLSEVVLDLAGEASVAFQAVKNGPIAVGIGELNSLAPGAPLGWETVNNTVAATLGSDEESDSQSRLRRVDTLALQGIAISEAITSALNNINGVKSLSYRENFTDTDQVIDGVFLLKHSVYACVDGGGNGEVALALLENKTAGANWNGALEIPVLDETSGQVYPVKFDRPVLVQVWIRVTIAPTTVSNPSDVIDDAVLKYVNGELEGQRGFVVGANASPFEIASAVNIEAPTIFVRQVELSTDGLVYNVAEIPVEIFEVARTSAAQITTVIVP